MHFPGKARCFHRRHPDRCSGLLLTFLLVMCLSLFSFGYSKVPDNMPQEKSAGSSRGSDSISPGFDQKSGKDESAEDRSDGNAALETATPFLSDPDSAQIHSFSPDTGNNSSSETGSAESASAGHSSAEKASMEAIHPEQARASSDSSSADMTSMEAIHPEQTRASSDSSSSDMTSMEAMHPEQTRASSDSSSAQKEDSSISASSPPYLLKYIDAWKEWHTMEVDPSVDQCTYDPELFIEKDGRMAYRDDRYEVLYGVDVSGHQGYIDWEAVAGAGYSFAFIRVGYRGYGEAGNLYEDAAAIDNLRRAKAAGLRVGTYIFSQALNEEEARAEADLAVRLIKSSGVETDLPLMYDPELIKDDWGRANEITREQVSLNTAAFKDQVEKNSTLNVDIYSNLPWEHHFFDTDTMNQFEIWYADYEKAPQTPYHFTWWQYTNEGYVPGIAGQVDLDLWLRPKDAP